MGGEVAERAQKPQKGKRRPKRRISIILDMTPMVDIAFLLLIFYMVTTVFSMPQAMEINLPPKEQQEGELEVRESNLLTLRVDSESRYWWHLGIAEGGNLPNLLPTAPATPDTVTYQFWADTLQSLLIGQNRENPRLSTLILIHPDGTYGDLINLLDEIDLIERSWNARIANDLDKDVLDLERNERFSYRYAVGNWEDRDDRVMVAAVDQAQTEGKL